MEKRLLMAVVLSLLILVSYNAFIAQRYNLDKVKTATESAQEMSNLQVKTASVDIKKEPAVSSIPLANKELENSKLKIIVSNLGGKIQEVWFKDYNAHFFAQIPLGFDSTENLPFNFTSHRSDKVVLNYQDASRKITKKFQIRDEHILSFEMEVQDLTDANPHSHLACFGLDFKALKQDPQFQKERQFSELSFSLEDKVLRLNIGKINQNTATEQRTKVHWIGLRDKYFCALFKPDSEASGYFIKGQNNDTANAGFLMDSTKQQRISGILYIGPQDVQKMTMANAGFEQLIHFGAFDFISRFLVKILGFLHNILPNWGLDIVILSVLIFFFLYPLTLKSMKSMREMQKIQPQVEALKKQYKNDPQKLNKETMELYRAHKVNPFGGCLPLLLQIPIFFALYQALLRSTALKGSGFLWIKDLAEPDRLAMLPISIPILGNELNLLPILMAIIMFFQQKITAGANPAVDAQQQKFMTIFFPLFFAVIFYHFPSGLALYWTVYSFLSLASQWRQLSITRGQN